MPHQIAEFVLDPFSEDFATEPTTSNPRILTGLSKINLFVGPNNSGKSRFLRELAKVVEPKFRPTNSAFERLEKIRETFVRDLGEVLKGNVFDIDQVKAVAATIPSFLLIEAETEPLKSLIAAVQRAQKVRGHELKFAPSIMNAGFEHLLPRIKTIGDNTMSAINAVGADLATKIDFKRIYIPTLRGFGRAIGLSWWYAKKDSRLKILESLDALAVFAVRGWSDDHLNTPQCRILPPALPRSSTAN